MTVVLRGGGLLVAPLVFAGMIWGIVSLGGSPSQEGFLPSTVACGLLALVLTTIALRVEDTPAPKWRTHARHCALVYPGLLLGALGLGEGLTFWFGMLLLGTVTVTVVTNALVLAFANARG
jgi:drug/metabolite transporter (DMT)-like permease